MPIKREYVCDECEEVFEGTWNLFCHMEREHGIPFPDDFGKDPTAGGEMQKQLDEGLEAHYKANG